MKLPNSHRAVVDLNKLQDYSLNTDHPRGKNKARVFLSVLGITRNDAEWLKGQALKAAVHDEVVSEVESPFGKKYAIHANIQYKGKSASVCFSWIIEQGTDFPRLTSCYVKMKE